MTEHEKRIREALEAGPTEGPWATEVDDTNPNELNIISNNRPYVATVWPADASNDREQEANAAYIAACNPVAIRALLADLDAVRVKAARYDFLRDAHWSNAELCCVVDPKANVRLGATCPSGEHLDALIDAALKGATA